MTGLAVAGLSLVLLGVLARMLARENPHWWFEYRVGSTVGQPQILGWGIYAAFGALIALGAALVLRFPVRWLQYMVMEKEPEFEGDADDLTVAVEPGDEIGR